MTNSQITFLKLILSVLFIGCLWNWEYGYYQLIRFVGMIGFVILAYHERKNRALFPIWVLSAVLINPFFKVALGRTIWNFLDIAWAFILILTLFTNSQWSKRYFRNVWRIFRNGLKHQDHKQTDKTEMAKEEFISEASQLKEAEYIEESKGNTIKPTNTEQTTKKDQLFKEFKERRNREEKEKLLMLREKYSKLSESEIAELFNKAMEFQLSLENKPDDPTNTDDPPKLKKKSILNDPKQRRFFEKMGTIYKVTKPDTDDKKDESK